MVKVVFTKGAGGRYWSHVHRRDGVVLLLPGYDRKFRIPHDLAHFATERQLGLSDGVFGSLFAGAVFENMSVVAGRVRHDARQRSERILREHAKSGGIGTAEVLAGVVHHAVEGDVRARLFDDARVEWGIIRQEPFPYTAAQFRDAADTLAALATRWDALPVDATLDLTWP
ncbi:hypothetical protein [Amycolatopsis nigrescens]|uniref:hypothetical protein n=1 Tax=Amycolatopsis nigrescens TaxID=381445 RepID=UPI00037B14AF|nr:hypothetical protein [Amycolatopsis nigrescens]